MRARRAPDSEIGWTHVWDGGREQVPLSDAQAAALVMLGMITWSGIYRVYRVCADHTLEQVKSAVG